MRERFERFDKYMRYKKLNDNQVTIQCGLAQGLLAQARKGKSDLGSRTIDKILKEYQDLNKVWLLTGEGEMITMSPTMTSFGDNSPNVSGDGNRINDFSIFDKSLKEISEQRKLVSKSQEQLSKAQEQIDRLLAIIEKMSR